MLNAKRNWLLFVAALAMSCCVAFAGCSSGAASSSSADSASGESSAAAESSSGSESSEESSQAAEQSLVIGVEGEDAFAVEFTNETGAVITDLAVTPVGSAEEPTMLMKSGQQVAAGKSVIVGANAADGALYNVTVACGSDQYVLHNVNFETLEAATIRLEGDVAYLEIIADGVVSSTLTEEYDLAHPAVEEPAKETANETVYYEEPAVNQAPAQSEDACVSDIVLR